MTWSALRSLAALLVLVVATATASAADNTPFYRLGDPIIFRVTGTAAQYPISKPKEASSYRFVNPCAVDVRIKKVSSLSESITRTTGTRFLARTSEVVATSTPTYISIIAMSEPTEPCDVELQYGNGM